MKTVALALATLLASQAALADDEDACKVALDAVTRVLETPNHQFMTRTEGAAGTPRHSEIINTGIAMYVGYGGKWRTSPMSPKAMHDMMTDNQKRTACR